MPNTEGNSNAAVLDGGAFGAIIYGDKTPAQVIGNLVVTGGLTVDGGGFDVGPTGPTGPAGPNTLTSYVKGSLPPYTVAGALIFVSDATGAHVTGSQCFSVTGPTGPWIDVTTGVAVA